MRACDLGLEERTDEVGGWRGRAGSFQSTHAQVQWLLGLVKTLPPAVFAGWRSPQRGFP